MSLSCEKALTTASHRDSCVPIKFYLWRPKLPVVSLLRVARHSFDFFVTVGKCKAVLPPAIRNGGEGGLGDWSLSPSWIVAVMTGGVPWYPRCLRTCPPSGDSVGTTGLTHGHRKLIQCVVGKRPESVPCVQTSARAPCPRSLGRNGKGRRQSERHRP
jgi:hypothetical protein